ncbi:MAG TPA: MFS transporter [Gemmataceae bacterium]|nr:MFS transporter [Gemmataceae bacterium]
MQDSAPPTTTEPQAPPQKSNRAALLIVFLVVFIDLLGFGIVLPLLPRFGDDLLHHLIPGGKDAPIGGLILGLLMSSFSLMQFLFAPVWGRLSDRHGRRPILLVGLTGSVVFYTLFGVALGLSGTNPSLALTLIFVSRVGAGIAGATIGTAQAVIADSTPPQHRKHGMALIGAAFGIGFTFGPLIGFAALQWFPQMLGAVGYVAAGLSLAALMLALARLPETRQPGGPSAERRLFNWGAVRSVLRAPSVGTLVLIFFLATFGFGAFEATLALLNRDLLQFPDTDNFLVFAYVGFVLLFTQGYLYRKLARRMNEVTLLTIGIVLMGVGVATLGGAASAGAAGCSRELLLPWVFVSLAVSVMGFAFLTPSVQALVSRRSDPERQGEVLGVNQSAAALARILGPVIGLGLYKLEGSHLLPYAFGAVLLLLMLPLIPRIRRGV